MKPTIYVMIGLPGSGKSTFAQKYARENNAVIVSSDSIRKELYGDERIQGNPNEIFSLVYKRLQENTKQGINSIFDATNITKKDRKRIFYDCKEATLIAIFINTPMEECLRRNQLRERHVPNHVIENYSKKLVPPTIEEGFDEIIIK